MSALSHQSDNIVLTSEVICILFYGVPCYIFYRFIPFKIVIISYMFSY